MPEQYVHRIGRTARAGADGIAISFVAPDEKPYLRDIEKLTRVKLEMVPLPDDFVVEARRLPLPSVKSVAEATGDAASGQRRQGRGAGRPQRRDERPQGGERRERAPQGERSQGERRDRPQHAERTQTGERQARPERGAGNPRRDDGQRTFARAEPRQPGERSDRASVDIRIEGRGRPAWSERGAQGERAPRNAGGRYGESSNGDGRHQGQGRPNYDPIAVGPDGERLPKRLRPGVTEQRPQGQRPEGERGPRNGQAAGERPRRFGNGGGRPQGGNGGGRPQGGNGGGGRRSPAGR